MFGIKPPVAVVFPRWIDNLMVIITVAVVLAGLYGVAVAVYAFAPGSQRVGYAPRQPVEYSHALHAGELGIDCRYCHNTVEQSAQASLPPTQTCMNCHTHVRADSNKLVTVRESFATGTPIRWVRVHDLPDFVYFNHSAHVRRGIGCVTCHGRVDKMTVVSQQAPLTMGWCLDCHRNPEPYLRPVEEVTNMTWMPMEDAASLGRRLRETYNIHPSTDCSTCHR